MANIPIRNGYAKFFKECLYLQRKHTGNKTFVPKLFMMKADDTWNNVCYQFRKHHTSNIDIWEVLGAAKSAGTAKFRHLSHKGWSNAPYMNPVEFLNIIENHVDIIGMHEILFILVTNLLGYVHCPVETHRLNWFYNLYDKCGLDFNYSLKYSEIFDCDIYTDIIANDFSSSYPASLYE